LRGGLLLLGFGNLRRSHWRSSSFPFYGGGPFPPPNDVFFFFFHGRFMVSFHPDCRFSVDLVPLGNTTFPSVALFKKPQRFQFMLRAATAFSLCKGGFQHFSECFFSPPSFQGFTCPQSVVKQPGLSCICRFFSPFKARLVLLSPGTFFLLNV